MSNTPVGLPEPENVKSDQQTLAMSVFLRRRLGSYAEYAKKLSEVLRPKLVKGLVAEGFDQGDANAHVTKILGPLDEFCDHILHAKNAFSTFQHHFWTYYVNAIQDKRAERSRAADTVKVE